MVCPVAIVTLSFAPTFAICICWLSRPNQTLQWCRVGGGDGGYSAVMIAMVTDNKPPTHWTTFTPQARAVITTTFYLHSMYVLPQKPNLIFPPNRSTPRRRRLKSSRYGRKSSLHAGPTLSAFITVCVGWYMYSAYIVEENVYLRQLICSWHTFYH